MNELKPCPFCGGEAEEITGATAYCEGEHEVEHWTARVICHICGSGGRAVTRETDSESIDAAIEAWNTRAEGKDND